MLACAGRLWVSRNSASGAGPDLYAGSDSTRLSNSLYARWAGNTCWIRDQILDLPLLLAQRLAVCLRVAISKYWTFCTFHQVFIHRLNLAPHRFIVSSWLWRGRRACHRAGFYQKHHPLLLHHWLQVLLCWKCTRTPHRATFSFSSLWKPSLLMLHVCLLFHGHLS